MRCTAWQRTNGRATIVPRHLCHWAIFLVHAIYQLGKRKICLILKLVRAHQVDDVLFRHACLVISLIYLQVFATSEYSAHNLQHRGSQHFFCIDCLGTNEVWSPRTSAHHLVFEGKTSNCPWRRPSLTVSARSRDDPSKCQSAECFGEWANKMSKKKADTVKLYTTRFLRFHCNDRIDVVSKLFSICPVWCYS